MVKDLNDLLYEFLDGNPPSKLAGRRIKSCEERVELLEVCVKLMILGLRNFQLVKHQSEAGQVTLEQLIVSRTLVWCVCMEKETEKCTSVRRSMK